MKQNDTKYHTLYLDLKRIKEEYCIDESIDEHLNLIKELYEEYISLINDEKGKYGIRYKTIHDDSRWADSHTQFFISEEKRDKVFEDWKNNHCWDEIFEQDLEYRTPSPNVHDIVKVFKEKGNIYDEI